MWIITCSKFGFNVTICVFQMRWKMVTYDIYQNPHMEIQVSKYDVLHMFEEYPNVKVQMWTQMLLYSLAKYAKMRLTCELPNVKLNLTFYVSHLDY